MRAGEKLLNALFIFLEHVKTWNLTLTTHSRSCFFEVLIVQCQNSIKYILLRSLSAAMFTWPCKTNFTTVPDPLELQILLEDQTATEILFQSHAATTTIRMTWLACISHYVEDMFARHGTAPNGAKTQAPRGRQLYGPFVRWRIPLLLLLGPELISLFLFYLNLVVPVRF